MCHPREMSQSYPPVDKPCSPRFPRAIHFSLDLTGNVLSVSPSGASDLGYSPDTLLAQPIFNLINPKDRVRLRKALKVVSQQTDETVIEEIPLIRQDRSRLLMRMVAQPLQGSNHQATILLICEALARSGEAQPVQQGDLHQTAEFTQPNFTQPKQTEEAVRQQTHRQLVAAIVQHVRQQTEEAHYQQAREQLVSVIAQHIRQSLNLKQVLSTTVKEVRSFLQTDRVLIFRFEPNWSGSVLIESVEPPWKSIKGETFEDPCFSRSYVPMYREGRIRAIHSIYAKEVSPCYAKLLKQFQVNAVLVVPILQEDKLWGLLIAHHCRGPRQWHSVEIDLLRQLSAQVSIAIQQSELYQQVQRLNADLERQIQKHAAQLQLASEFEATLKRITDRVRDSLDEDQILQTAVRELALALGVAGCNAALYNLEQQTSTILYEYTTSPLVLQGRVVQMNNFPQGYGQLLHGQYFQFCSLVPHPQRGRVVMLACPIFDDRGVLGDLWLISQACHAFGEQDIRLVQQVANQCAIALRQARLYQKAQTQVQELEKLNRLKDDFLSTVSHELRTPMSNIKLATHMLELTLQRSTLLQPEASELAGPLMKYLKILRDECEREIRLINDLLDLSRLEAGIGEPVMSEIVLQNWLPHLIAPFVERALSQQQHLQIHISPEIPPLTTDLFRLERILGELLNNACKYTPANEHITLTAKAELNRVLLQIKNSGVEISAGDLSRVFDKFYRVPNHDPWKYGGTGLGLALVKKLVETLGGRIQVISESGQTCFTVELPLQGKAVCP